MEVRKRIDLIVAELDKKPLIASHGKTAVRLLAIAIAGMPLPGAGSVAMAIDHALSKFGEPDLKKKVTELANVISTLVDETTKAPSDLTGALVDLFEMNPALKNKLFGLQGAFLSKPQQLSITANGATNEFTENSVENMDVNVTASNHGYNMLTGISTFGGNVSISAHSGGVNKVSRSKFKGQPFGVVSMDNVSCYGSAQTIFQNGQVGIRVGEGGPLRVGEGGILRVGEGPIRFT